MANPDEPSCQPRNSFAIELPEPYLFEIYVKKNSDLASFSESRALTHYKSCGRKEGRVCSQIDSKAAFKALVPKSMSILEIGPYIRPAFKKDAYNVEYLDAFSTSELREKARAAPGENPANAPDIDYVWKGEPYSQLVNKTFGCVYSSHAIEHQPCLVYHLNQVSSVLEENGYYFIAVPDKRYCFDRFFPESTLADILDAYLLDRRAHSPRTLLRSRLLTTHNDPARHWSGEATVDPLKQPVTKAYGKRIKDTLALWRQRTGYVDGHAWQFTPDNFEHLIQCIYEAELSSMKLEVLYPTIKNRFEFFAVLRKASHS